MLFQFQLTSSAVGVASDHHGIVPNELDAMQHRAKAEGRRVSLVYFIPVFNNPKGHVMPTSRREELVRICTEHKVLLVADEVRTTWLMHQAAQSSSGVPNAYSDQRASTSTNGQFRV